MGRLDQYLDPLPDKQVELWLEELAPAWGEQFSRCQTCGNAYITSSTHKDLGICSPCKNHTIERNREYYRNNNQKCRQKNLVRMREFRNNSKSGGKDGG